MKAAYRKASTYGRRNSSMFRLKFKTVTGTVLFIAITLKIQVPAVRKFLLKEIKLVTTCD
jgi:hypothetical protein